MAIKIGFFWTPQIAASVLSDCLQSPELEVCFVVSQEDKPVGRKMVVTPPPVKVVAEAHKIPIFQPKTLKNNTEIYAQLRAFEVDYFIVVAYGKIFSKEVLEIPRKNCINIHTSLLPLYRGSSPIQSALLCGEKQTGITIMLMDEGMDEGDILSTHEIPLCPSCTAEDIFTLMGDMAGKLLVDTLKKWDAWDIKSLPQKHQLATYCRKISKQDGQISFQTETAQEIFQKWQAFYSWPGIFTFFEEKRILFLQCDVDNEENNHSPGQVFMKDDDGKHLYIQTPQGALGVTLLQLEGKKPMTIPEFLCGYKHVLSYQF